MIGKLFAFLVPARLPHGLRRLCLGRPPGRRAVSVRRPGPGGMVGLAAHGAGHGSHWSHGQARAASLQDAERGGLLADDGLLLGRCLPEKPSKRAAVLALLAPRLGSESACRTFLAAFFGKQWIADRMLRTHTHVHLATIAPTGAGKASAC